MPATLNSPAAANGSPRRSLNDTIGRLDEMIDGLSVAIPETIRDSLRESIGVAIAEGVKAAVIEVLSNPALLAAIRGQARPGLRQRLAAAIARARARAVRWVRSAVTGAITRGTAATGVVRHVRAHLHKAWAARIPVSVALGLGLAAGLAVAWAPPWVGAALTGLGTVCLSLAVQAGLWARRAVSRLALV